MERMIEHLRAERAQLGPDQKPKPKSAEKAERQEALAAAKSPEETLALLGLAVKPLGEM